MAKLKITLTKNPGDVWLKTGISSMSDYTQDEWDNIIRPHKMYVDSLEGLDTSLTEIVEEGDVMTTTMFFDTLENATSAKDKLFGPEVLPVVTNRNNLVVAKLQSLGINYTRQITVE